MAARKLQQEVDKCFKKVAEGVTEFSAIYEKIEQSNNPAQKDKLEDNLKREIKKLQRLRDQIKTWAASNDIKDKAPLLEHRKLIETQMEKFKAVEKAMKTKAYSKEGLSAAAKLDPKEQAKVEASEFLSSMVDDLEQQIETLEAEGESIQATMKKGKNNSAKAERIAEVERVIERHKWHQGKLELIRRSLENGGVEPEQVNDLEESIRYYVSDGMNEDFIEDEEMYEELDLEDEEGTYGMGLDNEKNSSLDTQSVQEDLAADIEPPKLLSRKAQKEADSARRTSSQTKSPLPALATLHAPLTTISNGSAGGPPMKPASVPTRPAGEGLKYASAAAAAAASDKNNVGIAPLPPPPGAASSSISPLPQSRTSATNSPATSLIQPASQQAESKQSTPAITAAEPEPVPVPVPVKPSKRSKAAGKQPAVPEATESPKPPQTNGASNGVKRIEEAEEECIYHLPSSLQDLVDTYETSRKRPAPPSAPSTLRIMTSSQGTCPDVQDADVPRSYRPDVPVPPTVSGFPREPLAIFEDPRLYSKIDPDTLFYVFYYKQGSPQQYLAAKALKDQSWRFHKQYQTWFQRHEEPKNITEDFEQGTYRFFDYESTWMNRRKADFKFAYKFLEDEV
ncbi:general negative regulator of transcription subunit 5 [Fusarium falciforme]|uniref:General negative regulator of transcription subunit n=1 Tax=Fusarium falciforme TaxID=195108 RepID=A0A9W8V362_9HYPO|nr:general negative regulator of transcription subunit 5 [Fusarium falciforme]KAJ4206710.1 general negative regulator of transcription subunit 5 [Fusarium falciforme]KAJ4260956.1 general negative regulator of transcription subunit 5 [Fusarium falciforme]